MGFEHISQPLASPKVFLVRVARSLLLSAVLIAISLAGGMVGYRHFEHFSWVDSFANASMILSGMGPLAPMQTTGGKIFAGSYALFSGLFLIIVAGLILAPVLHRILHRLHVADEDENAPDQA